MGKPTGFMEYKRQEMNHRPVEERIHDYDEFLLPTAPAVMKEQGARCMDCGVSFCHSGIMMAGMVMGCPLGNLIPEINDLLYRGHYEEAYKRLSKTNPFPQFTGRVCPAPCEGSCTLGEHEPPVAIKNIEYAVIEFMRRQNKLSPRIPKQHTGRRVAIVGSGPAGLACADTLNQLGHTVTVFERADRPGGLLMYGIPNMKLDKSVVLEAVTRMEEEGVTFVLNTEIGSDFPVANLLEDYHAIVLCGGATKPRMLTVPGSDLSGIHPAVSFLSQNTKSLLDSNLQDSHFISAKDKNVIIIGGGDTGTDCAATSIRHGAKSVTQFEIMEKPPAERLPENPWPEWPRVLKVDYGQEEAIHVFGKDPRRYCTTVKEIRGNEEGIITEVQTVQVEWGTDSMGRRVPKEIPGSEKSQPADLILIAMGFLGPEETLTQQLQLKKDPRGNVLASEDDYKSSLPCVFTAGDMRRGQSLVVWALTEGKKAALSCDRFLQESVF